MPSLIRIGVVGLGFAQQVLIPAFRSDSRCVVAGICARRFDRAGQVAQNLGIPRAYRDSREMIADPGLAALAIAAPPAVQAGIALEAARAGKHLFCEKPLALDAAGAAHIIAAARAARIAHAIDFEFPELDAWQKARRVIQAGTLGKLRQAVLNWRVESYSYRAQTGPSWKTQAGPGGGTLNNFGSHAFYNLEWLFGPIRRLAARFSRHETETEARVDLWAETAGGLPLNAAIAADAYLGPGHCLEIYGDAGSLRLENATADHLRGFTLRVATRSRAEYERLPTDEDPGGQDGRILPVSRLVRRFLDAIESNGQVTPSLVDGMRVQFLLDAARAAARAGSWQEVASTV